MKRLVFLILILFLTVSGTFHDALTILSEDSHPLTSQILSDAAIIMDRDTGQILDEKNSEERIYPASLTKMMTGILTIEKCSDLNQKVTVTKAMIEGLAEQDASLSGFQPGDKPTIQDLLYGISLSSGADSCNALADVVTGHHPKKFISMMNQKAKEIGMKNTHFNNTSGLHDPEHYSTAGDMAVLLQYCLNNSVFQKIFSAKQYTTTPLASAPEGLTFSSTLWSVAKWYPTDGLIGGKTGYTIPAGHCMAAWADVNHMHLVIVTAHADTPMYQMSHMQDVGRILQLLQTWSKEKVMKKDQKITSIQIVHPFHKEAMTIHAPADVYLDLPADHTLKMKCTLPHKLTAGNKEQRISGTFLITDQKLPVYEIDLQVRIPAEKNIFAKAYLWIQSFLS